MASKVRGGFMEREKPGSVGRGVLGKLSRVVCLVELPNQWVGSVCSGA
jgi:hypothetical protein